MSESEQQQFIYIIRPTRPEMLSTGLNEREAELVDRHFLYLQNLTSEGTALLVGRTLNTDPSAFGVVIYKAESHRQALKIMAADPAISGGVMTGEMFPYKIVMHSLDG